LVPPKDVAALRAALCRLLCEPALRAALGAAARRRLTENFGWPVVAREYVALYQRHAPEAQLQEATPG